MRLTTPRAPLSSRAARRPDDPAARSQSSSTHAGRSRPSLLTTFAVVSLVPLAALAFGLFYFLQGQIRSRALDGARNSATLVARSSVEPLLARTNLSSPLGTDLRRRLD